MERVEKISAQDTIQKLASLANWQLQAKQGHDNAEQRIALEKVLQQEVSKWGGVR